MHAMVLKKLGAALEWTELADRQPGPGEIRVKVAACGVCRTDLHVIDGELPDPQVPIIPGHEIVGRIDAISCPELAQVGVMMRCRVRGKKTAFAFRSERRTRSCLSDSGINSLLSRNQKKRKIHLPCQFRGLA